MEVSLNSYKQVKFEKFIEAQQEKEKQTWTTHLPVMLETITEVIKNHPCRTEEKWQQSTLPKLRELYAAARKTAAAGNIFTVGGSKDCLDQMRAMINSWAVGSGVFLEINKTMDTRYYGKAAIAKEFHLAFMVDGREMPVNPAMELLRERIVKHKKEAPVRKAAAQKRLAEIEENKKKVSATPIEYKGSINVLGHKLDSDTVSEIIRSYRIYGRLDMKIGDINALIMYTDSNNSSLKQYIKGKPVICKELSDLIGKSVYVGIWP